MTKLAMAFIFVFCAVIADCVVAGDRDAEKPQTLHAAVKDFNEKARENPVGSSQPPLTVDEVVAAIRKWQPHEKSRETEKVSQVFQEITETRQLPERADLSFCTGWRDGAGYHCKVWWIDLSIMTGEKTGYTCRIRDRRISRRMLSPEERIEQQLEELKASIRSQRPEGGESEAEPE